MKIAFSILILLISATTCCLGQSKPIPKNIHQAILYLNSESSDSLKKIIKATEDKNLVNLSYPSGDNFKSIAEWTSRSENSPFVQYLSSKGISFHETEILLIAFKAFLLGQPVDEDRIIAPFKAIEDKWAKEDKVRFTTDSLRGIYIPKDLEDCFNQISSFWADSVKAKMKKLSEDYFSGMQHPGFGMWMRNNWQLWGGSRLSKYFNDKEIYHPEDMSGIILRSYHRFLNNREIKLEEQLKFYQDYWKKVEIDERNRKDKELSAFKIGDTLSYKYNFGYVSAEQEKKYDNDICIAKGIITAIDKEKYILKVKLLEGCDKKGIIYYDNKNSETWNKKTKKWEQPKKREIKRMKVGQENRFNYSDWEVE
jgi:hypothetical protein